MSAIAGLWRFDGKPGTAADCERMLAAQEIYGPHDERVWSEGPVAVGRRLFRTLPEDIHDRQPLQTRDGRLTLVADIRMDNRNELAGALGLSDGEVRGFSDAAVLLACLDRWGEGALDRVVGDFAFVLWDAYARTLTLARDFSGKRPLHFHRGRDFFAFSSMPKGLHALSEIPRAPDEQAAAELSLMIPEKSSRSFFAGIERVRAAHALTVTPERITSRCYWEPRRPGPGRMSSQHYIEGLRHHLDQATLARLRGSDGKIGSQLSGGLDSSAVTATAARLLAAERGKVIAFTAVPRKDYDGADRERRLVDEGPLAAATAALYPNIEHVLIRSGHVSPLAGLDRAFFLCDRPIVSPSNWASGQAINEEARTRKLDVMLFGSMGNMTLSYHGRDFLAESLRAGRLVSLLRVGAQLVSTGDMNWRGVFTSSLGPFMPLRFWRWANSRFGTRKRNPLNYSAIRAERMDALERTSLTDRHGFDFTFRRWGDSFATRRWAIAYFDPGNFLKGALGGWGVDLRDPTADKRLVEYCLSIPTEHYLTDGIPRALARTALADRLPQSVLNERRAGYQVADWSEGLMAARSEIADELSRLSECAPAAALLDIERLRGLVDTLPASGWDRRENIRNYRLALLRGIALGHFLRKASGTNR